MLLLNTVILLMAPPAQADLPLPRDISTIYSYQCEGNFLEGEGVTPYQIDCIPHQRLGLIKAKFTAYLFAASSGSNLHEKSPDKFYSGSICGRTLPRLNCATSVPEKKFGLSRQPEGIFQTKVIFSPAFSDYTRVYGYGALPKADGNCPKGLVKAQARLAKPKTINAPLPSSFSNEYGRQNDHILHVEGEPLPEFAVYRMPNFQPCDSFGDCSNVIVSPRELAQTAAYEAVAEKPAICVIPKHSL